MVEADLRLCAKGSREHPPAWWEWTAVGETIGYPHPDLLPSREKAEAALPWQQRREVGDTMGHPHPDLLPSREKVENLSPGQNGGITFRHPRGSGQIPSPRREGTTGRGLLGRK